MKKNGKNGASLTTTLVLIGLMSMITSVMFTMSTHRSHAANRMADRTRATALAESGARHAYSIIANDFNTCANEDAFPKSGGQNLLSPERRFDAIIFNSPELFT